MAPITFKNLIVRDDNMSIDNPTTFYLLIILVVLLFIGFLSVAALMLLRLIHRRRAQQGTECVEKPQPKNHRRSRHPPSISITNEKAALFETADSSGPPSPVPEIHITFPDEEGHGNKRQSGRVVVVRISETGGVGLEPYQEQLPAYQKEDGARFQSLDLERIGGLKEKEHGSRF